MSDDWKKRLFLEKGLWDVFKVSSRTITRPKINRVLFVSALLAFTLLVIWGAIFGIEFYSVNSSAEFAHDMADTAILLCLSILGFLIAGFSIFASVTKVDLFILLAHLPYKVEGKETGLSRLQFIFFNFLNVFSVYFGLLSISLVVNLGFSKHSPLTLIGEVIAVSFPKIVLTCNLIVVAIIGVWIIDAILRLKSFIWNLYQAVLLAIATESELQERASSEAAGSQNSEASSGH